MNKKITMLLLVVVLAAMGLVFFTQMQATDSDQLSAQGKPGISRDGRVLPTNGTGNGTGLSGADSASGGPDGAPKPVTLTAGQEFASSQPKANATAAGKKDPADAGRADVNTATAEAAKKPEKTSGAPGLTPWETPPKKQPEKKADTAAKAQQKPAAAAKGEEKTAEVKPKKDDKPQAKAKPEKAPEPGVRSLKNIKLTPKGQSMHLRIEADGGFSCKTFVLTGPDRLVIDLPGEWNGVRPPSVPSNQLVKKARVGDQPAGPRIVLDLARPIRGHQVQRLDNAIEVVLQ